jgi:hypothetical protein
MNTERTSLFLMANLGAEVSRLLSAKEKNDTAETNESLARALKIIEKINAMSDMQTRLGEISLLRQVIVDIVEPKPILQASRKELTSYFEPFALRLLRE